MNAPPPFPSPPSPEPPRMSGSVARILDQLIKIPGTQRGIGLDPLLGLIPGLGDALAAGLGGLILLEAARSGAPRSLLVRMGGNLFLNAAIGSIPLAGDLFSVWFQSNIRNHALLTAWRNERRKLPASPQSKWVAGGCVLLALAVAGLCALAWWLVSALWHLVMS